MSLILLDQQDGICTVQLNRPKANALNQEMFDALIDTFQKLETDDTVNAVVMTGQYPFFSAGLDVFSLAQLGPQEAIHFFKSFYQVIHSLLRFSKPLVAAISGHSHAGGCVMALCCDYRIMLDEDPFVIGMNEVAVGIMVPAFIKDLYAFVIGEARAQKYLLEGKLMSAQEAHQAELVDLCVPTASLMTAAKKRALFYSQFDPTTFAMIKQNCRKNILAVLSSSAEGDTRDILEHFQKETSKKVLMQHLAKLKK